MTVPPARVTAITRTVAPVAAAASAIRVRSPRTGTPLHPQPPLRRVVVEHRDRPVRGVVLAASAGCTSWVPALPAPKTMTFSAEEARRPGPLPDGERRVPRAQHRQQRDGRGGRGGLERRMLARYQDQPGGDDTRSGQAGRRC